MIREYIILLSDKQDAELVKRSEALGIEDDLSLLQSYVNEWLAPERDREHTEK